MAEQGPKGWYASRKVWIALVAAVLVGAVALLGRSQGLSEETIATAIAAIAALAGVLLGTHAYTDVRALGATTTRGIENDRNHDFMTLLSQLVPTVLEGLAARKEPAAAAREPELWVDTPDGVAHPLPRADVPTPSDAMDRDAYVAALTSLLESRPIYEWEQKPGKRPERIGVELLDNLPDDWTTHEIYSALMTMIDGHTIYVADPDTAPDTDTDTDDDA